MPDQDEPVDFGEEPVEPIEPANSARAKIQQGDAADRLAKD